MRSEDSRPMRPTGLEVGTVVAQQQRHGHTEGLSQAPALLDDNTCKIITPSAKACHFLCQSMPLFALRVVDASAKWDMHGAHVPIELSLQLLIRQRPGGRKARS
jgi:hypothetical protein